MPDAFKIGESHVEALRASRLTQFERRGSDFLRGRFPDETAAISDEDLSRRVRDGVGRASGYGLSTERHVMAFVATSMLAGERFDDEPDGWARSILNGCGLNADDKAKLLLIAATERAQAATIPELT